MERIANESGINCTLYANETIWSSSEPSTDDSAIFLQKWYWCGMWTFVSLIWCITKVTAKLGSQPVIKHGEWGVRALAYFSALMIFGSLMSVKNFFASDFAANLVTSIIMICFFHLILLPNVPLYFDNWEYTSPIGLIFIILGFSGFIITTFLISPFLFFGSPVKCTIFNVLFSGFLVILLCIIVRFLSSSFQTVTSQILAKIAEKDEPNNTTGEKKGSVGNVKQQNTVHEAILGGLATAYKYEQQFQPSILLRLMKLIVVLAGATCAFFAPFVIQNGPVLGLGYSVCCTVGFIIFTFVDSNSW
eukprot:TRINITY_DN1886_c0_g1_i1.p1 TRINITY_DN1886_c0_g1~~TRINITY_DN1886_c0_g1_i1.p1  ORF type:complete len:304 (+),score=28.87 TRINITY_DN1886_c0_g1_i1:46-957(+)